MKSIRITLYFVSILLITNACKTSQSGTSEGKTQRAVAFTVNLNDLSEDTFKVTVTPSAKLSDDNNIYQFASTAPGTYQVMDMGRFVKSFQAFDKKGNVIATTQINTNQFELSEPKKVRTIVYEISETYDTPVDEYPIYPMCGSSIEEDHAVINGQTVFGYFKGLQSSPIEVTLERPDNWLVGTALAPNSNGAYVAKSYDHLVDSPIMLGKLTKASTKIDDTTIDIYSYSATDKVTAEEALNSVEGMLKSASKFLDGLPVDRYTFLLFIETNSLQPKGAWEHSYSSFYVYDENTWDNLEESFLHVASHEFFHVVTPLNIHSEIIHEFNFVTPVPSDHLWLYEGVTEWASHAMLFRSGERSEEDYFKALRRKMYLSQNYFDSSWSILDLAQKSFTKEGQKQYGNIYMKGALVAGLLDIRLLELSEGKKGLIDVIKELAKIYGPEKPFDEATFFQYFTDYTHPEIADFFERYIKNSEELPIIEYYQKLGIAYNPDTFVFSNDEEATEEQLKLRASWMAPL